MHKLFQILHVKANDIRRRWSSSYPREPPRLASPRAYPKYYLASGNFSRAIAYFARSTVPHAKELAVIKICIWAITTKLLINSLFVKQWIETRTLHMLILRRRRSFAVPFASLPRTTSDVWESGYLNLAVIFNSYLPRAIMALVLPTTWLRTPVADHFILWNSDKIYIHRPRGHGTADRGGSPFYSAISGSGILQSLRELYREEKRFVPAAKR